MQTSDKKAWIKALADAGVPEIEVGSFVPAKILPQLADTAELVEFARSIPQLAVAVLVPNLRGAQNALRVKPHKISIPLSLSETHSLKNLNRSHAQVLAEVSEIRNAIDAMAPADRPRFEGSLSTAFGCTLEGEVPEARVYEMAEKLMQAGCDELGLSDTTGFASPVQVRTYVKGI
ncbi:MAG: hydroxymethylglutaryl-CoA lyase, partial [Pseudomonadota bacterium]